MEDNDKKFFAKIESTAYTQNGKLKVDTILTGINMDKIPEMYDVSGQFIGWRMLSKEAEYAAKKKPEENTFIVTVE